MGNLRDRPPGAASGGGRRGKGKKKKNGSSPNSLIFPVDLDSTPRAQRAPGCSQKEREGLCLSKALEAAPLAPLDAALGGVESEGKRRFPSGFAFPASLGGSLCCSLHPLTPLATVGPPGAGMSLSPSRPSPLRPSAASARQGNSSGFGSGRWNKLQNILNFFFPLQDLGLEGSRAPGRDAAGKGSGMLAEPRWDLGRGGCPPRGDPRWGGGARPRCGRSRGAGIEFLEPHP